MAEIEINGYSLCLEKFEKLVFADNSVKIQEKAWENIENSFSFLKNFSKDKLIYGINTGFGPMAVYRIDDQALNQLQYNLVRSHSSGMGGYQDEIYCKAILVTELHSLIRSYSGVSKDLIICFQEMLKNKIYPCIPKHGGVGASGDLVQLAHLALAVIGEGEVYDGSEIKAAAKAFEEKGIKPFKIELREGISMMNGTAGMTGIAAINLIQGFRACEWSLMFSCMINEMVEVYDDHLSVQLNRAKRHSGQNKIAEIARDILDGSDLLRSREKDLYERKVSERFLDHKVQEFYSLRCIPQILGPILDTLTYAQGVVEDELNSTSDNPVIDWQENNVFHGGNFHGDYISLEMDKIKLALVRLSMLSERQINYLLNHKINEKLAPFVNMGTLGLNFGMQGMQFTATSTTAENQALSSSVYVHSIPNNNDNQDIVSMGSNAATIVSKVIDNTFEVLSIQALTIAQAIDQLKIYDRMSPKTKIIYDKIRSLVPPYVEDRASFKEQNEIKRYLKETPLNILKRQS